MTKQQVLENAKSLPVADRIDLVHELWDSIDADDVPLTPAMREELDRRIAAFDANPTKGRPWAEVRAELLRGEL